MKRDAVTIMKVIQDVVQLRRTTEERGPVVVHCRSEPISVLVCLAGSFVCILVTLLDAQEYSV